MATARTWSLCVRSGGPAAQPDLLAADRVPEPDRVIGPARGDEAAPRMHRHRGHRPGVAADGQQPAAGVEVADRYPGVRRPRAQRIDRLAVAPQVVERE